MTYVNNLSSPTEAHNTPGLDVAVLRLNLLEDIRNTADGLGWSTSSLEEIAELLFLLLLYDCQSHASSNIEYHRSRVEVFIEDSIPQSIGRGRKGRTVSGGKSLISTGFPSKKSGMKT